MVPSDSDPTSDTRMLSLLRHAKSSWEDPGLADRDRPLNPRGRRSAQRVASHLARSGAMPQRVLCSPALRTRETLEFLRPLLPEQTEVQIDERVYGASAGELADCLRQLEDRWQHVLVIGHNPGLEELASWLVGASDTKLARRLRRKFPTGALARLRLAGQHWSELTAGSGKLVEFTRPRDLA